jgi:hypothetical protein
VQEAQAAVGTKPALGVFKVFGCYSTAPAVGLKFWGSLQSPEFSQGEFFGILFFADVASSFADGEPVARG